MNPDIGKIRVSAQESAMICDRCEGKGIVLSEPASHWKPEAWDGQERRKETREEAGVPFEEVPAPFYSTCEKCQGLGRILPGLLSSR
jgi:hypothetical protein